MKYRKKPSIVEAIQWTGTNFDDVVKFVGAGKIARHSFNDELLMFRYDGNAVAIGWYIIKDAEGDCTRMHAFTFNNEYELAEPTTDSRGIMTEPA